MKRIIFRAICALLSVLVLIGCFPLMVGAANRIKISTVVAQSNLDEIAVLYNRTRKLTFSLSEGEPVRFNQSWETCWETYNEETEEWENYSGRLYPGKYRVFAQLRIDEEWGTTHELDQAMTCTVDGEAWTLEPVSVHPTYSSVFATSPEILIEDDPSITEPVDVEEVHLKLNGYVEGQLFSAIHLTPYMGSEEMIELTEPPLFVETTDSNANGIPDSFETGSETPEFADDVIKPSTEYMMVMRFRALPGYDIALLRMEGIRLPFRRAGMFDNMFLMYDENTGILQASIFLTPCVNTVEFTEEPPAQVIGYRGDIYGSAEISWATNGAVDAYRIYRWDEVNHWNVSPVAEVFSTSYVFEYDGVDEVRYRIEAIKTENIAATSSEFTLSWQKKQPITLPIRIDGSALVGSKTPVSLKEYYPESDQYTIAEESIYPINQWIDMETDLPVAEFVHGKQYFYAIEIIANPGYYFDISAILIPGEGLLTPDAVRVYGVDWELTQNLLDESDFLAGFVFTYDEAVGIPAEKENLLNELVFDGSSLVGMNTPEPIPSEIFVHEALTLCDDDCDCGKVPAPAKQQANRWINLLTHQPAEEFSAATPFTYTLFFHVKDGWKFSGVPNTFDFTLSNVNLEILEFSYRPDLQMISVSLGFFNEEGTSIEEGAHVCIKTKKAATSPSCTASGSIAHYACACGKTYEDRWGIREIADFNATGVIAPIAHIFASDWLRDAESHWKTCSCGAIGEKATHTDSNHDNSCDLCNYVITTGAPSQGTQPDPTPQPPAHAHSFEEEWTLTAEEHYKACACGEKKLAGAHVDSNANGSCDICGYVLVQPEPDGIGVGAIVGIVIGSVAAVGFGGFALFWFVIKKKSFTELFAIFRKKA